MKKHILFGLLTFSFCISCLPLIGIVGHHRRSSQKWHLFNQSILEAKIQLDKQKEIADQNHSFSDKPTFQLSTINQHSRAIPRLEKEKAFLQSIPEHSILFHDPKIITRKKTLATMPLIMWAESLSSSEETKISLANAIEMDLDELILFLNLFNPKNKRLPLGFFSQLELTRQTTPLNHQVWCVQAEVICR